MATKRDMDRPQSVPPANSLTERLGDQSLKASSSHGHLSRLDLRQGISVGSSSDVVDENGSQPAGRIRASRSRFRSERNVADYWLISWRVSVRDP